MTLSNEQFANKPTLVKGDGPMQKQRRWFKQFYSLPIQLEYEEEVDKKEKEKLIDSNKLDSSLKDICSMAANNVQISDSF